MNVWHECLRVFTSFYELFDHLWWFKNTQNREKVQNAEARIVFKKFILPILPKLWIFRWNRALKSEKESISERLSHVKFHVGNFLPQKLNFFKIWFSQIWKMQIFGVKIHFSWKNWAETIEFWKMSRILGSKMKIRPPSKQKRVKCGSSDNPGHRNYRLLHKIANFWKKIRSFNLDFEPRKS